MVLLDVLEKNLEKGHETDELKSSKEDLQKWVDDVVKTLNEEEMKQVVERYALERNSGNYK